jgi:hypothetical protein
MKDLLNTIGTAVLGTIVGTLMGAHELYLIARAFVRRHITRRPKP